MVPKGGFEPPRVAPYAPQAHVSANSTTSALGVATSGDRGPAGPEGTLIIAKPVATASSLVVVPRLLAAVPAPDLLRETRRLAGLRRRIRNRKHCDILFREQVAPGSSSDLDFSIDGCDRQGRVGRRQQHPVVQRLEDRHHLALQCHEVVHERVLVQVAPQRNASPVIMAVQSLALSFAVRDEVTGREDKVVFAYRDPIIVHRAQPCLSFRWKRPGKPRRLLSYAAG